MLLCYFATPTGAVLHRNSTGLVSIKGFRRVSRQPSGRAMNFASENVPAGLVNTLSGAETREELRDPRDASERGIGELLAIVNDFCQVPMSHVMGLEDPEAYVAGELHGPKQAGAVL